MGVTGLWSLLEPAGREADLKSARGKVLAVDISIWLQQIVKGMRDGRGEAIPNAHLLGLFSRICKLLHFGIKPIFVYDGGTPPLKAQTLATRRKRRGEGEEKLKTARKRLLTNKLKRYALGDKEALRRDAGCERGSGQRQAKRKFLAEADADLFSLKEQPISTSLASADSDGNENEGASDTWCYDTRSVDFESADFRALPYEVQHDILVERLEAEESRSKRGKTRYQSDAEAFSRDQIAALQTRNIISRLLDEVRAKLLVIDSESGVSYHKIVSEANTVYVLEKQPHQSLVDSAETSFAAAPSAVIGESTAGPDLQSQNQSICNIALQRFQERKRKVHRGVEHTTEDMSDSESLSFGSDENDAMSNIETIESPRPQVSLGDDDSDANVQAAILQSFSGQPFESDKHRSTLQTQSLSRTIADTEVIASLERPTGTGSIAMADDNVHPSWTPPSLKSSHIAQVAPVENIKSQVLFHSQRKSNSHSRPSEERINQHLADAAVLMPQVATTTVNCIASSVSSSAESQSESELEEVTPSTIERSVELQEDRLTLPLEPQLKPEPLVKMECKIESADVHPTHPAHLSTLEKPATTTATNLISAENCTIDPPSSSDALASATGQVSLDDQNADDDDDKIISSPGEMAADDHEGELETENEDDTHWDSFSEIAPGISLSDVASKLDAAHAASTALEAEMTELNTLAKKAAAAAAGLTSGMLAESQALIQMFGLPFMVAPMEAEAQCAALELDGVTSGTITDDSDIFLFGGKVVYRRVCSRTKDPEIYEATGIHRCLGLNRERLIRLAHLLGCDYTSGISGVGVVTAMEILAEFPGDTGLEKFRQWMHSSDEGGTRVLQALKRRKKQLLVPDGLPDPRVRDAFLFPQVDHRKAETFAWEDIDVNGLRDMAYARFGWEYDRTDQMLAPVVRNGAIQSSNHQPTLADFFKVESKNVDVEMLGRKRMKAAIDRVKGLDTRRE